MYALLLSIPVITGPLAMVVFMWSFYGIKHNKRGVVLKEHASYFPIIGSLGNESKSDLKEPSIMRHRPDVRMGLG